LRKEEIAAAEVEERLGRRGELIDRIGRQLDDDVEVLKASGNGPVELADCLEHCRSTRPAIALRRPTCMDGDSCDVRSGIALTDSYDVACWSVLKLSTWAGIGVRECLWKTFDVHKLEERHLAVVSKTTHQCFKSLCRKSCINRRATLASVRHIKL